MTAESDAHNEWLDWLWGRIKPRADHFTISMTKAEWENLFSLARRGADAAARIERLEKALREIAEYDAGPKVTSGFDEPISARIARAALERKPDGN